MAAEKAANPSTKTEPAKEDEPNNMLSIAVLMVLYTLQGIPMGLSSSVPFLLQGKVRLVRYGSSSRVH
ncbi:unnamed protein product [Aphanomyces euteiches]